MSLITPQIKVDDLQQYVSSISPTGGAMSWEDSNHTIVYDVPGQRLYDACILLLGYAFVNNVDSARAAARTTGYLWRRNPVRHPLFPWMICTKIESVQGLGPRGKVSIANPLGIPGLASYHALYAKYRVTAQFSNPPYDILEDSDLVILGNRGDEKQRYFWKEGVETTANFISIEGKSLHAAPDPGVPTAVSGHKFKGFGRAVPETVQLYKFRWTKVPEAYVVNESTMLPDKLNFCLNKVNSKPFLGFPAYTLFFDPYGYERKRMPIADTDSQPDWWVDITLNLKYFNPPNTFPGATVAGWLLAPFESDGRYYHVLREDNSELFHACDFNKVVTPFQDTLLNDF